MGKKERNGAGKVLAGNRQASHNYHLGERFEAGLVLLGTEVKSLRAGKANLRDAYVRVERGEAFLLNCHVASYSHRGYADHDPLRPRKLLLHREEILRLASKTTAGQTIIPLRIYLAKGRIKVEVALARGKQLWDKRQAIREREREREARAATRRP